MSVRTTATTATNAPLVMKKVRAPAAAKKDVPKAPRTKKAAAGAPKNGSKASSPTRPPANQSPVNKDKAGDSLDNITSGIKKITLVTNKQKEARARENKKSASATKDQATGGSLGSSLPVTPSRDPILAANGNDDIKATTPDMPQTMAHQETTITPTVDTNGGGTASMKTPEGPPPPGQPETPDVFVQYQPEGRQPEALTPQGPLTWLPVNAGATPSPVKQQEPPAAAAVPSTVLLPRTPSPNDRATPSPMKRGELPVFTPTSQLRFAAPARPAAGVPMEPSAPPSASASSTPPRAGSRVAEARRKLGDAVWEVPETPQ